MQNGTIAGINEKGYGFIKVEGRDKDLFFHMNELVNARIDDLRPGDAVTFEVTSSPKGDQASQVSKV